MTVHMFEVLVSIVCSGLTGLLMGICVGVCMGSDAERRKMRDRDEKQENFNERNN